MVPVSSRFAGHVDRIVRAIWFGRVGGQSPAPSWLRRQCFARPCIVARSGEPTVDLHDFFTFIVANPTEDLDAAPYGGARFPVDARLAGRTFAKFHVDVSTGDVLGEPHETLSGRDWLEFAGIPQAKLRSISREEQFAEKLHAYTLP